MFSICYALPWNVKVVQRETKHRVWASKWREMMHFQWTVRAVSIIQTVTLVYGMCWNRSGKNESVYVIYETIWHLEHGIHEAKPFDMRFSLNADPIKWSVYGFRNDNWNGVVQVLHTLSVFVTDSLSKNSRVEQHYGNNKDWCNGAEQSTV